MARLRFLLATLILVTYGCSAISARDSSGDLLWSSIPLNSMHLRLQSPKPKGMSEDLYFGNGTLAIESCINGTCTAPATVWNIQNNRLKIGYSSNDGDALIQYTAQKLVIRGPNGEIDVYSIVSK